LEDFESLVLSGGMIEDKVAKLIEESREHIEE